jgi:hypothetical protein
MTHQPPDFREVETNPRPPLTYANRCATYASPLDIRIRFLQESVFPRGTALHGDVPTIEITNIADLVLAPSVAKRLIDDLTAAIKQHEFMTNSHVPTLESVHQAATRQMKRSTERVN